ncbi:MAG: amidohydrolase family protein [Verrucomicrobiales bacterium]
MSIPIIDTHQHLILADRWPYSWTKDAPALAGKVFDYAAYQKAIEGTGIEATVFMETTPDDPHWHEESVLVDGMSREPGSLIRGMILNCRPEHDGFADYLDGIADLRVSGLRRFLHAAPEGTVESPYFLPSLKELGRRGLPFDLCVFESQLALAEKIARACPDTRFVLDHCGVPKIDGGRFKDWARGISALAKVDNVVCKISGVFAYCPEGEATTARVRPYVEHCIEAFEWDRVVWGSDWPVVTVTSSLRAWVESTREILASEDAHHPAKRLHRNAGEV